MSNKVMKLDADESVFFERQLEYVKAKTYDKKFTELKQRSVIPTSFEAGPGAETIKYEQWDQFGLAKIVANYATDFPRTDVKAKEFRAPVKSLGDSYGYNLQEIRNAAQAGKPLSQRKANSAKRAMMQLENKIAMFGDADSGLPGWLTNPNIPDVVLPADGVGGLTTFASKVTTPGLIVRDLNSIINAVPDQSRGVEIADTLLLPVSQWTLISSTPRSDQSDYTILKYVMENNPFLRSTDWLNELAAANGELANDTAMCYRRDPDVFQLEVPVDFEQFPAQEQGLDYEIPCHQRCAGVIIYYPLAMAKSDDI